MNLYDFSDETIWAIVPGAMDNLLEALPRMLAQEDVFQAKIRMNEQTYTPELTVSNGVAVIPLSGAVSKTMGLFSFLFGGAPLDRFVMDLRAAALDDRVAAIVTYIDSPGGPVSMVPDAAAALFAARVKKPVVAFSDGGILSAAYWIGASADKMVVSPVASVGGIGVLTLHVDASKMDEQVGIKRTYISAGKYKTEGNSAEPLSDAARGRIQARLNETYGVFVRSVAAGRGASEEKVRSEMADGRVFIGQQAVDAGLADHLGSLEDAIEMAREMAAGRDKRYGAGAASAAVSPAITKNGAAMPAKTTNKEVGFMEIKTIDELRAAHPDLVKQIEAAATAGVDVKTPAETAAATEQARILGLAAVHFGEEAGKKFAAVAAGNITVDQYKALKDALAPAASAGGVDQDAAFKAEMLKKIAASGASGVGAGGVESGPTTFEEAVAAIMAADQCSRSKALSKAVGMYPKLHKAYIDAANVRAAVVE